MKHDIKLNTLGGSFCEKCHNWSNLPDGLNDSDCEEIIINTAKDE